VQLKGRIRIFLNIKNQCQQLKEIKHINATFCKINDQIHCGGKHEKKTIIQEDT
jgi:hypothetical protein